MQLHLSESHIFKGAPLFLFKQALTEGNNLHERYFVRVLKLNLKINKQMFTYCAKWNVVIASQAKPVHVVIAIILVNA